MTRFRNRTDAGGRLARRLGKLSLGKPAVLAIPRGGVDVALPVARTLNVPVGIMMLRKLHIPTSPEAGFGAVTLDGTMILNDEIVRRAGLDSATIHRVRNEVLRQLRRRESRYAPYIVETLTGKDAIVVDDGLATGYTMLAAVASARNAAASSVTVAVPVSSESAYEALAPECDRFVTLVVSPRLPFAVAGFYDHWEDLTDEEVLAQLESSRAKR